MISPGPVLTSEVAGAAEVIGVVGGVVEAEVVVAVVDGVGGRLTVTVV